MGGKQSSNNNSSRVDQASSGGSPMASTSGGSSAGLGLLSLRQRGEGSSAEARQRARSLSHVLNGHSGQPISISPHHASFEISGSPDTDRSAPVELPISRVYAAHSLPVQLVSFHGIKCPVCSKFVPPDDVECHLVMCLTKPRIIYNEDVLTEDKGECVICLDDLTQGDTIARLPCLCIYHKVCIDAWFKVNRSCPEHPLD
ncbi:hypothetical protein JTE90_028628 [Oedothorax gibbosus]|uniref:E3 ubiquitin-protein ligase ZNRF1 n=1 Tax=Oedothorax gibbosus TaxID=931172 RepID=A0AAV6V013_9ARAC|nr:hypothetical protein JTE90_028628 [Oedothorax gibbosus]